MKIGDMTDALQVGTPHSVALWHIADELRHVHALLDLAARRRRPDAILIRTLLRRRNELLRRMQLLAHDARQADMCEHGLQSYH